VARGMSAPPGVGEIHISPPCASWDIVDTHALGFDAARRLFTHAPRTRPPVRDVAITAPKKPAVRAPVFVPDSSARWSHLRLPHACPEEPRSKPARLWTLAHRGVMLAWDNTPRRGKAAHIAHGATPRRTEPGSNKVLEAGDGVQPRQESLGFRLKPGWSVWCDGARRHEPRLHLEPGFLDCDARMALHAVQEGRWADGRRARMRPDRSAGNLVWGERAIGSSRSMVWRFVTVHGGWRSRASWVPGEK